MVKPLVGARGSSPPNYVLIDARRAIQNRFITKLSLVRHSGFTLGWGSLLGISVAVCLYLALVLRK